MACADMFSKCPEDVKMEIINMLDEPEYLCALGTVSTVWNKSIKDDKIWRGLFFRDFMWWDPSGKEVSMKEGQTWKDKYMEYHLRGWQWDQTRCNTKIVMSNNNFSSSLTTGYTYHGIRTTRGEEKGKHYFEVLVERVENNEQNLKFDKGTSIFMGIGIANGQFDPENCSSGWTRQNSGVGYYNDGQIYAFSERHYGRNQKVSFRTGDRVGFELDLGDGKRDGTITFYINGTPVTDPIPGLRGKVFPHLILANEIKNTITITTGRKAKIEAVAQRNYKEAIGVLEGMGFFNRELCMELLHKHSGDVEKVIEELLVF